MALKPETIARIQGLLDGTIKPEPIPPFDPKTISAETRAAVQAIWDEAIAREPIPEPPVPLIGFDDNSEEDNVAQPDAQDLAGADSIIKAMSDANHGDYSAFREQIAVEVYTTGHYNGNWDVSFFPQDHDESSVLAGFRVIQEDEFDQHMDDDEDAPDHDDMIAEVNNGYLFLE